jgi:ferrous iron transport protein A
MTIPMKDLTAGQQGQVREVKAGGHLRRRLLELGLIPGTFIERLMVSPAGDPACYRIRGAMIALRRSDADQVIVEI